MLNRELNVGGFVEGFCEVFFYKSLDKTFKSEMLRKRLSIMKRKKFLKKNRHYDKQEGYTIVEILLLTLVIGLTFSVSLPLFGAVINKARQKEATLS